MNYMKMITLKEKLSRKEKGALLIVGSLLFIITVLATSVFAAYITSPTIIQVSPTNNQLSIATTGVVTIRFSEPMDASTINAYTFTVEQRTTPATGSSSSEYRSRQLDGTITYDGTLATFTPILGLGMHNPMQPDQQYGNVFTVTVTTGVKDLAGNSLPQNYVWSFTTGGDSFNTKTLTTTSQSNQSSASSAVPVAVIPPPTQPPITTVQGTTTNAWPWIWIIGGLFLLVVLALLIVGLVMTPTRQKNTKDLKATRTSPFGDVHPVIDLEGIGPIYNKALHAMGIKDTKQLWEANPAKVARETGAPLSTVQSWQEMAELATVKGIGPQYAELLERSGVHSIDQLKNSNPDKLLKRVQEKQDSLLVNIQGNPPGHAIVEHWISEARHHKFSETGEAAA